MSAFIGTDVRRRQLTELDFVGWLGQADPDSIFEYHRGFLAVDVDPHVAQLAYPDRITLARLGRRAHQAAERGLVHLVQRRIARDTFSYLAIARPRPAQAPPSIIDLMAVDAPRNPKNDGGAARSARTGRHSFGARSTPRRHPIQSHAQSPDQAIGQ